MPSSTVTTLQPILKQVYEKLAQETLYDAKPLYALMPKDTKFVGENIQIPLRYSPEPGGSATFSSALANRGPSGYKRFALTRRKDYAIGSLETELVRAAKGGNTAAVIDAMESTIRGLRNTALRSLCRSLYGAGGGFRAQVTSGMASSTITLLNPKDIVWFEVGMKLDGSANDGLSGAATAGGAAAKIVSINRDSGTLTNDGSANWNAATGINGLSANWYLFRQGDFGLTMIGLDGWIPSTVSATAFFGVDRTLDSERLAGCRITPATTGYTYSTIEGACLAILERVYMAGGAPDKIFLHPQRYKRLCDELGAKKVYNDVKSEAGISFKGVYIEGQGGPCTVMSDPCCPRDTGWALTMDTWKLRTLGEPFSITDDDGNAPWMREADDDAIQIRLATYGNPSCDAPAYNGRFDLTGIALCHPGKRSRRYARRRPAWRCSLGASRRTGQATRSARATRAQASASCTTAAPVSGKSPSPARPFATSSRSQPPCSSTPHR